FYFYTCHTMIMRKVLFVLFVVCCSRTQAQIKVSTWLTDPAKRVFFEKQRGTARGASDVTIKVDGGQTYQTIDGYGWALTGGSAQHIVRMSAPARAALLRDLFGTTGNAIGGSYLRVSIG